MIKLSDYVIRFIADQGVKHLFLVPGGGAMYLNDSLGRCESITYVSNLHEQASAIAAEAYARVTNNLGVCMVTTGPGGTNAITGVAGAWLDSTPVLIVSGQVKRADMKGISDVRQLGSQEIDIVSIVRTITKYAVTVTDPQSIRYHMEKAVFLARAGRRGPVWIDIPLDVQAAVIDEDSLNPYIPDEPAQPAQSEDLARKVRLALELFNQAERPVILAGNGIRMAGAEGKFLDVVDLLGVPVLTTWLGLDLIPDSHPLLAGRPGSIAPRGANFTLQNSDWLLCLGSRLDMALTGYAHDRFASAAHKVFVDIDPAEIAKFQAPIDVPIVADAGEFLRELLRQADLIHAGRPAWVQRTQEWKRRYPVVTAEHRTGAQISAYHFSEVLSEELAEGELVVPGSSGFAIEIFLLVLGVKTGQRVFHNRGTGAMGYGLPAALGACVAAGGKRTVSVDGDGGFQFNIQELATVAALGLPVKYFVLNNGGYASIRSSQDRYFPGNRMACDASSGVVLPDLVAQARAYGISTVRIDRPADLRSGIRRVLASDGPALCEVVAMPDEERQPRLASAAGQPARRSSTWKATTPAKAVSTGSSRK